ncbi:hypothetical protein C9374_014111 [Naegleria lovaniensis]|uniref:Uncharacterized protein n=1 Tax=Naegleria lovaniensis TaxID=51637 RepID=A0AA88GW72_NAELO|nr:uncharacterized protein C9374_014111 [Naegleria lovaniensis]KAG2389551.1 hypothetical protein C9374_014111 [Naegleria lovaniensis]
MMTIDRATSSPTCLHGYGFTDLPDALMVEIYSFLYEIPIVPYYHDRNSRTKRSSYENTQGHFWEHQSECTLAFPHTCRKIMMALEKDPNFQLMKFIQFYCLGIRNGRYDGIEELYRDVNSENVWKQIIPIVIYLNFPPLEYIESLEFKKDVIPLERKFRQAYNLHTFFDYEDFLFKIDRIVEMLTMFVNCVKNDIQSKHVNLHDISSIDLVFPISNDYTINMTYSHLTQILCEADRVVATCMSIFHWKAYKHSYFEEMYMEIPQELPRIRENYQLCAQLCTALKDSTADNQEVLNSLFSNLNCYYCDKLSAACYYSRKFFNRHVILHALHNTSCLSQDDYDKYDQEIIERAIFANGENFILLPSYIQQQQGEEMLMTALRRGLLLNRLLENNRMVDSPDSTFMKTNELFFKAMDMMLKDNDFAYDVIKTLAREKKGLSCIAYYIKRRLMNMDLKVAHPSKYNKHNCLFFDWKMMYLILHADGHSYRPTSFFRPQLYASYFVNVLMRLRSDTIDNITICIPHGLSLDTQNFIIEHNKKFFHTLNKVGLIQRSDYNSVYFNEE